MAESKVELMVVLSGYLLVCMRVAAMVALLVVQLVDKWAGWSAALRVE